MTERPNLVWQWAYCQKGAWSKFDSSWWRKSWHGYKPGSGAGRATPDIPSYGWHGAPVHGVFLPVLWLSGDYVTPSCDRKLTHSGRPSSLKSFVRTLPMTINTSMQTPVLSLSLSLRIMWKTRLENSFCILELVVSILLDFLCSWTSGAELQDLTKVEGPEF